MKRPRHRRALKPEAAGAREPARSPDRPWAEKPSRLLRTLGHSTWLLGFFLIGATIISYLPVFHAGVIWDDRSFVFDNPLIHRPDGLYGFWFSTQPVDFYPMTSTMLWVEWRLWGASPLGYHVVNVLLHALSALVLWRALQRLHIPGAWLAAALFALHPVNVESVAWIAQRKNTLAMFFYLLSLLWYLRFDPIFRPGPEAAGLANRPQDRSSQWRWYWFSLAAFLAALLSKTAVAPMPLVLLGLIWWRRGRLGRSDAWHTLPFLATAVVVGLISLWFQSHRAIGSDVVRVDSLWARLAGAGWAVWFYLYKAALPFGLSSIYPRWQIDEGHWWSYVPGLLLVTAFLACWRYRRRWGQGPLLTLGYFVVMLLPVLGFMNIGFMRLSLVADHWQYFAIIGPLSLAAAAITTAHGLARTGRLFPAVAFGGVLLVVLAGLTWRQCGLYVDPGTFWRAALAANPDSWLAHNNLGSVLFDQGQVDKAMVHFQRAVEIEPDYSTAHYNLGGALHQKGQTEEAITHFRKALEIQPKYAMAHYNLGEILRQSGQTDEAIAHFRAALEIQPEYAEAHNSLGASLFRKGRVDEALIHLQRALELQPNQAETHNNFANLLWQKGQVQQAIAHYQKALAIRPDYAMAQQNLGEILQQEGRDQEAVIHFGKALEIQPDFAAAGNSLAWVLATSPEASVRDGARAIALAQGAQQLSRGSNPLFIATLAAAYAEARRFPEAIETANRALQLATAQKRTALASRLQVQIALYQAGAPFRDTGRPGN